MPVFVLDCVAMLVPRVFVCGVLVFYGSGCYLLVRCWVDGLFVLLLVGFEDHHANYDIMVHFLRYPFGS